MKTTSPAMLKKSALAIVAHPDDIEFVAAGTLLLLQQAGWEIHYFNVCTGHGGSVRHDAATLRRIRLAEAKRAAKILGAHFYPPIADDMEVFYNLKLLRKVAAVVRKARPSIVLTHAPQDYMEDHMNTCRLAVTAAFTREMPNFVTTPRLPPVSGDVTLYHAQPHMQRDGLRRRVEPGLFIDTTTTHATKLAALAEHQSQQDWLDVSQGMNSYLKTMEDLSRELGKMSGRFQHAEGWRRHLHPGYCAEDADPLREVLGRRCLVNKKYERGLERR